MARRKAGGRLGKLERSGIFLPPSATAQAGESLTVSTAPAASVPRKVETKARDALEKSNPPVAGTPNNPPVAGSDCPLPDVPGIAWELDRDGGWECYHAPEGRRAPRRTKKYLGRVGKRQLAKWAALPESERLATVAQWIADRRAGKGL